MSKMRLGLVALLSLAWLSLLAGGDCEFDVDLDGWGRGFYDYVYYEDVYYDPYYPCCY